MVVPDVALCVRKNWRTDMPAADLGHPSPRPHPAGSTPTEGETEECTKWVPLRDPGLLFLQEDDLYDPL